jgi:hypothetical protein
MVALSVFDITCKAFPTEHVSLNTTLQFQDKIRAREIPRKDVGDFTEPRWLLLRNFLITTHFYVSMAVTLMNTDSPPRLQAEMHVNVAPYRAL